jgi:uncharacterized membrane protein YfcA
MPFSLQQYILVSVVLFFSSIVLGAVGFAAGLFGIPLLVLSGVSFPDAVAMSLVAAAPQNLIPAWQLRREIDFRRALRPMLIRYAFMPLGVFTLWLIGHANKDTASQIVGCLVLGIVALQWFWKVQPQPRIHDAWEWLAFSLGGFLLGLCGMGGPVMVLWVLAHDWPMNKARAFLFFLFLTGLPVQGLLMWSFFGREVLDAMLLAAAALPAVLAGLSVGLAVARAAPDRTLRTATVSVLILIAASAIIAPYLRK